jgi:molecular chaperone GrpE
MSEPVETQSPESELSKQVEELTAQRDREHDLFLRTLAEFDNYRKRTQRDQARAGLNGKREILLSLLEVLDAFERAFRQTLDSPETEQALRSLYNQLSKVVTTEGVEPFESLGCPFDPTLHEAIATLPPNGGIPGLVVEEHRRGYYWHDELLRPAQVTVLQ